LPRGTSPYLDEKLPVSELGEMKLVIGKKEPDEENPINYLIRNKINAPTEHMVRSHAMRWRIETFI
jgi:hypothetical protein